MAANYWASTQRLYWQFTREDLAEIRESLEEEDNSLVQQYALPERRLLSIFFKERVFTSDLDTLRRSTNLMTRASKARKAK